MNDGRRPVRRRIGAANWALAGVVALCMLLGIGHLEDWASPSPSPAATKVTAQQSSGHNGASTAGPAAARDTQACFRRQTVSPTSLDSQHASAFALSMLGT